MPPKNRKTQCYKRFRAWQLATWQPGNLIVLSKQGEHLARRQELIGFSRGGDRKSDEFQKPTVGLRSTKEIAHDIGISETSMKNRMQAARNILPEVKEVM